MTYYLDANIISYILKNVPGVINRLKDFVTKGNEIKIPVIAYYEVKRGLLSIKAQKKIEIFELQIKAFGLVPMTEKTFNLAAESYAKLKAAGELIEDADLFIGCSALENNAILLTNNEKHLKRIEGLQIEVIK